MNDSIQNNTNLKDIEARSKEIAEQMGNALPFKFGKNIFAWNYFPKNSKQPYNAARICLFSMLERTTRRYPIQLEQIT